MAQKSLSLLESLGRGMKIFLWAPVLDNKYKKERSSGAEDALGNNTDEANKYKWAMAIKGRMVTERKVVSK